MLLKNIDSATKYWDLFNKKELSDMPITYHISGWYKWVDGNFSAIYVKMNKLFIAWNDNQICLNDDGFVVLQGTQYVDKKKFSLFQCGDLLLSFVYAVEEDFSKIPPFEYLNTEDFDWGLLLMNMINKKDRRKNLIQQWMVNT